MPKLTPAQAQLEDDAAWAEQFRSSSTNLSQRQRYDDTVAEADAAQAVRNEATYERNLSGNKGMRDLVLGRERLKQQQSNADREFQFKQEQAAFNEGMKIKAANIQQLNESRRMKKELRDIDTAERILTDTTKFEDEIGEMTKFGLREGTPGFAVGMMRALLNNPHVSKDVRDSYLKAARVDDDPDVLFAHIQDKGLEPASATLDGDGKIRYTFRDPKSATGSSKSKSGAGDIDKEMLAMRTRWLDSAQKAESISDTEQKQRAQEDAESHYQDYQALRRQKFGLSGLPGGAGAVPKDAIPKSSETPSPIIEQWRESMGWTKGPSDAASQGPTQRTSKPKGEQIDIEEIFK